MKSRVARDLTEELPGKRLWAADGSGKTVWLQDDGCWTISWKFWWPGAYEGELAAWFAFEFDYEQLLDLQESKNQQNGGTGGVIGLHDLVLLRVRTMLGGS